MQHGCVSLIYARGLDFCVLVYFVLVVVSLVVNIGGILLCVEEDEKLFLVTLCHSCHLLQGVPKNGPLF